MRFLLRYLASTLVGQQDLEDICNQVCVCVCGSVCGGRESGSLSQGLLLM